MSKAMRSNIMLLLTAAIWGFAFVPQRLSLAHITPFAFNGLRFALGALSLVPLMLWQQRGKAGWSWPHRPVWIGGGLAGVAVFAGAFCQQAGLISTTAGKAGFITGLYVIFVPLLSMLWGHHTTRAVWAGAVCAAVGLYFLSVTEQFTIASGDLVVLLGALFWAGQVILLGRYAGKADPLQLAFTQFITCSALSLISAFIFESFTVANIRDALWPILYGGVISVGIAYTLQVIAQRDAHPSYAAVLFSLEGVFAAISGWLVLGETLSPRGLLGCGLMLAGLILAQLAPSTPLIKSE